MRQRPDPPHILIPIRLAETEVRPELLPNHVRVEHLHPVAAPAQLTVGRLAYGRFPGAAQAREPHRQPVLPRVRPRPGRPGLTFDPVALGDDLHTRHNSDDYTQALFSGG